jgi:Zn-dependent protease with chaperone function
MDLDTLASGFRGKVPSVPLRLRFRLGLVLVALMTVLLPVIYLAVVISAGYGVYFHVVNHTWLLEGRGNGLVRGIMYAGPAIVGGVLVFFMWKPLLARPTRTATGITIERGEAPLLFELVERIRQAVGAPAPRALCLDSEVNASASFRRGLTSFVSRGDLTLTIGLPLVAGLDIRQLGGVLAHELGHFAQGSGMRLTYLIRTLNGWLARVAYERDSWDEWLARSAKEWDWRIGIVLHVARFTVWLTRKLLVLLAIIGNAIGTFMLREMEFDADRYEARVAGSAVFESTALRMRVLSVAHHQAIGISSAAWREGRLCEDLPGLVAALANRMPPALRAEIEADDAEQARAGIFDTHPPDRQRIDSAKAENAPGVLHLDGPAAVLLGDASPLPRRVSEAYYRDEAEIAVRAHQLRPLSEFLERHDVLVSEAEAAERYFGDVFDLFHPLPARQGTSSPSSLADGLEWLREARTVAQRLRSETPAPPAEETVEAPVDPGRLAAARAAARERLTAALGLLALAEVRDRLGGEGAGRMDEEIGRMRPALEAFTLEAEALQAIATTHDELVDLFDQWAEKGEASFVGGRITELLSNLHVQTAKLEHRLTGASYPFDHASGRLSIAAFAAQGLAAVDGLGPEVHERTGIVLRRLRDLHQRVLGRLATLAERIEHAAEPRA